MTTRSRRMARPLTLEPLESRSLLAALPPDFSETPIAAGLTNPTAMEIAPGGDVWVLEQSGAVKRFRAGSTTADIVGRINNLGLNASGERGLLGIAFDPQFATTKQVYLYYTSMQTNIHNRISRFTVNDTQAADYFFAGTSDTAADKGSTGVPTESVILDLDPLSATNHNGGAIHFGPDGKLYAAVGENAVPSNAQSLANLHGKILRMNPDGSAPPDNPFLAQTTGNRQLIWALGLRNPFTFAFQPGTSRMFINDVGQNTTEEINEGVAGANYGWPNTEGNAGTPPTGPGSYQPPLYTYGHGFGPFEGFAITGGAFYNPAAQMFPSLYAGDYFFADFVSDWINVLDVSTGSVSQFATNAGSPVDLRVAADGSLLYLSRSLGQVLRVTHPPPVNTAPTISPIIDRQMPIGGTLSVPFSISDAQSNPADLIVTAQADRPELLPPGSLTIAGTGASRTLEIAPPPGQSGDTLVYLTVSDGELAARTFFFLIVSNAAFPWHNPTSAFDVDNGGGAPGNGSFALPAGVTANDALIIINFLNTFGPMSLPPPTPLPGIGPEPPPFLDVAPSNTVTALDALYVINLLNAFASGAVGPEPEGEAAASASSSDVALLADLALLETYPAKKRRA